MPLSDAYLLKVCRSVGVPELLLEDGVQELRIAEWQGRSPHGLRSAAIDFVRHYGRYSKAGVVRDYGYIDGTEQSSRDFTATSDRIIDLERAWTSLSDGQRKALVRNLSGVVGNNTQNVYCSHARRKLREAC